MNFSRDSSPALRGPGSMIEPVRACASKVASRARRLRRLARPDLLAIEAAGREMGCGWRIVA
jgi:hypothetical protein